MATPRPRPLGPNKVISPTVGAPAPMPQGGFAPVPLPSPVHFTGNLQADQNAANTANQQRYGAGLNTLTGGYNSALGSIQQAIGDSASFGNAAQQKLDYQLQHNLANQQQSAVSRGLSGSTIADTMKDLPQRQYNDASAQVTEMQANRKAGLDLSAANTQQQGANSIAGFIAARNDSGPNAALYTQLQKQASSNPGQRNVSLGGAGSSGPGGFPNTIGGASTGGGLPNTSSSGGGGAATGGSPGFFTGNGSTSPAPSSISSTQGYTGGLPGGGSPVAGQDPMMGATSLMANGGFVQGQGQKIGATPAAGPAVQAAQPTQPASISSAMGQGTFNPTTGKWVPGGNGQINWG